MEETLVMKPTMLPVLRGIKWQLLMVMLSFLGSQISKAQEKMISLPDVPQPQPAIIVGTVVDVNDDTVPGASITLQGDDRVGSRTVVSNDRGFFEFSDLEPETYHVTIRADGFASWTSPDVMVKPGQYVILPVGRLRIATAVTSVTVGYSAEQVATEQVKIEEKQRTFGFIPNFYVSYDPNAAPLTSKLKFQLASKVAFDPVTFAGVAIVAAAGQAGEHPNYPEGWKGYGERYGADYANGFTDIMIGGAILPSILHQDPRYFYRGTGTGKSRALHAIRSAFVCRGDNGKPQPNYSTVGGDLASAAISNAYYPESNRGVGLFLTNFFIGTGQRVAANLAQEFFLRKHTSGAKAQE
jgi:hypothetical protein